MLVCVASVALAASRRAECGGAHTAVVFASQKLRCDARGSVALRNSLHCASLHSAQTAAASMSTTRATRANTPPCASRHRRNRPAAHRPLTSPGLGTPPVARQQHGRKSAPAGTPAWGRLWSAEQRKGECRRAQRASCSDSLRLFERSAQRVASSAVRPIPEQRRAVAAGDRSSEAPRPVCPQAQICREVQAYRFTPVPPTQQQKSHAPQTPHPAS